MKEAILKIDQLVTERLILIPFTTQICENLLQGNFSDITSMGFIKGKNWPDSDVMETLPRIINNLSMVEAPTGFESWMIIKKDTLEIIGDAGFKGFNHQDQNIDIGYGVIEEERRKGYAEEAVIALIRWAFSSNRVKEITASCLPDNAGSVKLLKKVNFIESKRDDNMMYWTLLNTNT